MASATYSKNPVVNAAVSINSTASSGSLYTAPSNGYALINLTLDSGVYATQGVTALVIGASASSGSVYYVNRTGANFFTNINGYVGDDSNLGGIVSGVSSGMVATLNDVVVGPGQSIFIVRSTSGVQTTIGRAMVNGVEFING
jgi:hypothetical protein